MEVIHMKKNPNDNYYTTENEIIIEDGDTGEQQIFFMDIENGLVIRSFMEDEIDCIISQYDNITSSEKRKRLNTIYGLPRTVIGMGMKYWAGKGPTRPYEQIELYIYEKYQQYTISSQRSLTSLTQKLGLKGETYIQA